MQKRITFTPVCGHDKSLILTWLEKPHVKEWFHGDGLKSTIEGLNRFLNNDGPWAQLWLAYYDSTPFAYLITSNVESSQADDKDDPLSKWIEPGKKMSTLDLLIGEEDYLGKGIGSQLIESFINTVLRDCDIIFIDPEKSNTKAIHVYEKVGFTKIDKFIASWHPVPHVLMQLKR